MGAGQKEIASLRGHGDTAATVRHTHVSGGATGALVEMRWGEVASDAVEIVAARRFLVASVVCGK